MAAGHYYKCRDPKNTIRNVRFGTRALLSAYPYLGDVHTEGLVGFETTLFTKEGKRYYEDANDAQDAVEDLGLEVQDPVTLQDDTCRLVPGHVYKCRNEEYTLRNVQIRLDESDVVFTMIADVYTSINGGMLFSAGVTYTARGRFASTSTSQYDAIEDFGMEIEEETLASDASAINPKDLIGVKKPNLNLVPPSLMLAASAAFAEGAAKYGAYNWRDYPIQGSVYTSALLRHLLAYMDGEDIDQDSGLPHLYKITGCIALLIDSNELGILKDDRPGKGPASTMIKKLTRGN